MISKKTPHIYRQKYDICKAIEGPAYAMSSIACWSSLLVAIFVATYLFGWYNSSETTLLGQLLGWLA